MDDVLAAPNFENPACVSTDPEIFFPKSPLEIKNQPGGSPLRDMKSYAGKALSPIEVAKSICMECEHRIDCLSYALNNNIRWGIWGGTTLKEREKLNRLMRDG